MDRTLYRTLLLFAATLLVIWGFLAVLSPFLIAIAWALCLAAISYKRYTALARRWRKPRLAAALMVALTVIVILAPAGLALYLAGEEIVRLGSSGISSWVDQLRDQLPKVYAFLNAKLAALGAGTVDDIAKAAGEQAPALIWGSLARGAWNVLGSLFATLMSIAIMFVTQYFVYTESARLRGVVLGLSPLSGKDNDRILTTLRDNTSAAVLGGVLVAMIQGALGGIGFAIVGVDAPVLWGVVMALFSLLPFGGAAFVWVPVALFRFGTGQIGSGIFLVLWGAVLVGLVDNLLRPWILRRSGSNVHPMLLFFGILSGIGLFGMSGIVFGPLLIALLVTAAELYREHKQREDEKHAVAAPVEAGE